METFNKTYCDEEMNEWLVCPVCKCQINCTKDQTKRLIHSKNLHHIFGGNSSYKKASEKYGYVTFVHPICHREIHDNPEKELELKIDAKNDFLEKGHSEEEFTKIFGNLYEINNSNQRW